MKFSPLASLSLFLLMGFAHQAHASKVTVAIENVPSSRGTLLVALCRKKEFAKEICAYHQKVAAHAPSVSVTFEEVPFGVYAVKTFADMNDNNRLDTSFLGIPREPFGFSRNPSLRFHFPEFDECSFYVGARDASLVIRLKTN